MAIKYAWSFPTPLEVAETEGKFENIVKVVSWVLTATDGERSETLSNRLGMDPPDPADFTPFEKLIEAEIIDWVENNPALDIPALKAELAARFDVPEPVEPPATVTMAAPFQEDDAK